MNRKMYKQSTSLMYRATYFYYEKGFAQSQIADRLGISVSTVSRLLKNAKNQNLVTYNVDKSVLEVACLEEDIKEKYNLKEVIIARWLDEESEPTREDIKKIVGFEGAKYIQRIIGDTDTLGITFGRTMYHMINSLNPCQKKDTQFLTLHGNLRNIDKSLSAANLVKTMAMSFGGKRYCIEDPAHVSSEEETKEILEKEENKIIFSKFKNVNIAITGIGSFYPKHESYLCKAKYFSDELLEEFDEKGVYTDLALNFLDKNGKTINTRLTNKTIGISTEDFKKIPTKITMVSGAYKKYSLEAVLKGNLVDVLIIDYHLGKELIALK